MEQLFIPSNGIQLHVAQDGPSDGPLVILLHGFPEFWYGWRGQIPALAAAGYRVWAPDQRGYNLSDKPAGLAAYTLDALAADVIGLADAAGRERFSLVGHDWGAAVAWWVALKHPQRLERLVTINVPHPAVMARHVRRSPAQLWRSWYILFFQLPRLPEAFMRSGGSYRAAEGALLRSSRPGTFSSDDLAHYCAAWAQPGALTAMLNWYRAVLRRPSPPPADGRIRVPTLLIWGAQDAFLGREMAQPSVDLCSDGRLALFERATHWVHHEEAPQVNKLLIEFLSV